MLEGRVFGKFLQGALLGLSVAFAPGPLQTYLLSQTLRRGWVRTIPIALAPIPSDAFIICTLTFVLSKITSPFLSAIEISGGVFLIYVGAHMMKQTWRVDDEEVKLDPQLHRLTEATLLNALNPNPWIFWGTYGGPMLVEFWHASPTYVAAFLIGFYGTFIASMLFLAFLFERVAMRAQRLVQILGMVAALFLIGFGLMQIVTVGKRLGGWTAV